MKPHNVGLNQMFIVTVYMPTIMLDMIEDNDLHGTDTLSLWCFVPTKYAHV